MTHGFIIVPPELQYTYSFCDPGPRPLFEEKTGMKKVLVDLSTSKSDNMRSILKIKKPTSHFEDDLGSDVAGAVPTSHFENHLRSDVSSAVYLITEPKLKTTKRDFKRSSESERNIHNDGDNILNFSYL